MALAAFLCEGRGEEGVAGWSLDLIVSASVVVGNAVLGWLQETKAAQTLAVLERMIIATSAVIRVDRVARVPSFG